MSRYTLPTIHNEVYPGGAGPQYHGSIGAPRARWARPELGNHAMMTPGQHCDEWGGLLRDARFGAARPWRFNHFSYSSPTHFPSPAYGEACDGDLATAPRGGNGGGAFSAFSVVVAVGPSRGGKSGGH